MGTGGGGDNIPENRKLPKKEQDLFRSIVKFYETKQYKKGLKAADTILKKYPNHGETLAMKGLTLNCLEKKEEAYDLVRKGLRNDLRSHVCWHVFGLLHRSDRNYHEAIKCYLNALRIDTDNLQILRDLSLLQVQMRDLPGFVETRRRLLNLKSGQKQNWFAYAVGNCLVRNYTAAVKVIDSFLGTQDTRERNYEESELVLYKGLLLEKAGRLEDALELLDAEEKYVVDGLARRTKRAELLLRLGRYNEARQGFMDLVDVDTENYRYHAGLQSAVLLLDSETSTAMLSLKGCDLPSTVLSLTDEQRSKLAALYEELLTEAPKSLTIQNVPLAFLTGDQFRDRIDGYMRRQIARALPSLGATLSSLYLIADPETGNRVVAKDAHDIRRNDNFRTICSLVDGYIDSLRTSQAFPPPPSGGTANGSACEESPTTLLWALYLKVQLLESEGRLQNAVKVIDECIEHTPTAIDMLQRKARLLKRSGDLSQAADVMNDARMLDLADRYVNNKTTKYLLRAGRVEQAQSTIALFAKHEGDPQYNLFDMQCMWYELELGATRLRQRRFGQALKMFAAVEKHFADIIEDQFDFHTYCIRKMTLRAYNDILRFEDDVHGHEYHQRAVRGAVACYLALHERGPQDNHEIDEPDYSGMTKEQKKREKAKARKAAKKKVEEEGKARAQEEEKSKETSAAAAAAAQKDQGDDQDGKGNAGGKKKKATGKPVDDDPDGEKLAAKDPLVECARLVSILTKHGGQFVENQALAYDVAMKRGRPLLALQALLRGKRLRPSDPSVFVRIVGFVKQASTLSVHPTVAEVISTEQSSLLNDGSLESYVESYVTTAAPWSLPHSVAAAHGLCALKPVENKARASALIRQAAIADTRGINVANLVEAVEALESFEDHEAAAALRAHAATMFPVAADFQETAATNGQAPPDTTAGSEGGVGR